MQRSKPAPPELAAPAMRWAIVEISGPNRRRYAGLVSTTRIGQCAFVRVECPPIPALSLVLQSDCTIKGQFFPAGHDFTLKALPQLVKEFNAAHVHCITECTEEAAKEFQLDNRRTSLIAKIAPAPEQTEDAK